ncbi:glutamine synthetase family protein [Nonomuraea sp. NPDC049709]|uniref:glutamine synthetase family protein n=1 Tax=Nonomuraea sp. NPDC049709 TaxID=3154736 RepID=UPI0034204D21
MSSCALGWDLGQTDRLVVDYTGYHSGWHDIRLIPDLATLRPTPWWPGVAIVLADVADQSSGELLPLAPRTILREQLDRLPTGEYTASVGAELEYYLFPGGYDEARDKAYRDLAGGSLRRQQDLISHSIGREEAHHRELRDHLHQAGVGVRSHDAEWGRGQWELTLQHGEPMDMADQLVLAKLAVKAVAAAHGLAATFMARPTITDTGSSCHLNVSLWTPGGTPVFHDPDASHRMSRHMRHAIGGLLTHAPELMLFYAPTVNSYRRSASTQFAGHGATWGFDNRTVTCRVAGGNPSSLRVEFRVPGADCNPYLAIAGMLASVRDGIERRRDPSDPVTGNAYETGSNRLPNTLHYATQVFEESEFASAVFGKQVVAHYAANGRFEWEEFLNQVTDWELARYFEAI